MSTSSTATTVCVASSTSSSEPIRKSSRKRKQPDSYRPGDDALPARQRTRQKTSFHSKPNLAHHHGTTKVASRKKITSKAGGARGVTPGVVYVAQVLHHDQFGEHTETLGLYARKSVCAKVVREHIEREYGTELCEEYKVTEEPNGFVRVYAMGWEGESMDVRMVMRKVQA
jgi:hypothetical protein